MRCEVGVHTGRIVLKFAQDDYDAIRRHCPAAIGHRSWFLMERDGGIVMERSQYGVTPHRTARQPTTVQLHADCETIVRCHSHHREVQFPSRGKVFVSMPPHHLWPWMQDVSSRLKHITPDKWRWHLVQELNARVKSATLAHVDFDVKGLPEWANRMLSANERLSLMRNEELVR